MRITEVELSGCLRVVTELLPKMASAGHTGKVGSCLVSSSYKGRCTQLPLGHPLTTRQHNLGNNSLMTSSQLGGELRRLRD